MLCRDVSELRHQEQELITKDATIREIHHRVKNNLQTVASLLRIQARRTHSDEARDALTQAMRRVDAIAVVHDTLAQGLTQKVDFDEVFHRVLKLVAEVASAPNTRARTQSTGRFGVLPSEYATPLALALTEVVTNAVEHGLAGQEGFVTIDAKRTEDNLRVTVRDTGLGLPEGRIGQGSALRSSARSSRVSSVERSSGTGAMARAPKWSSTSPALAREVRAAASEQTKAA